MSGWELVGNGLEAKVTNKGKVMIRDAGKYPANDDYPHFMGSFDSSGNVVSFHSSDSRHGSRFGENEIVAVALSYLRGKGML
ncbi:hypothetical protein ANA_C13547 [Anabaena sp. 90]|jgi:hypothetical protein|uniref:hypothetical protein n=1 Tax=Anabaena sp. 90 TaxID=46234 RepID=UPI00029B7B9D|nr:hypothetical protein [Anabaena sp. 90]AFW96209.1 hypothetical protein ANA_C13547 [Anabaena sp. 90]